MPYGIIKVDTVTFTDNGVDKNISLSGLVQNPTFTGNVTATGTISGDIIRGGTTVSGLTVTGTTANFASGVFTTQVSGTTITGATVTATTGNFTSLTGTTTTGTTANFASGVFTTQVSGATIIAPTGTFTSLTGTTTTGTTANFVSGVFTTQVSGATVIAPTGTFTSLTGTTTTGTTANFVSGVFSTQLSGTTITGTTVATTTGTFVSLTGTTATFTSGIIASGTAALPSLAILSDPNTGIFSPGADQVAISTNGTGRLFISSGGNVGVNTSTPGVPLDVVADSGAIAYRARGRSSDNVSDIQFTDNGATAAYVNLRAPAANTFSILTNNAERLRITSAGNVGIGTSSPAERLHVGGIGQKILVAPVTYDVSQDSAYLIAGTTSYTGATTNWGTYGFQHRLKSSAGGIPRVTIDNSTGELFCVTNEGRVGIGTTSPGAALHVQGSATVTSQVNVAAKIGANTDSDVLIGSINGNSPFIASQGAYPLLFLTNASERARIDSSGRLLVGTSSGVSAAFVNSSIQTHGLTGDGSSITLYRFTTSATAAASSRLVMARSGSDTKDFTVVANGNRLGQLVFAGADGTQFVNAATIDCEVDGTPGATDMPSRLVFSTTADAGSTPTERLRITSAGVLQIAEAGNITVGTTTGTKIGTATTQKIGFYNATPVVQPTAVADATTAVDVITQLNALLAKLRTLGIIAT